MSDKTRDRAREALAQAITQIAWSLDFSDLERPKERKMMMSRADMALDALDAAGLMILEVPSDDPLGDAIKEALAEKRKREAGE
jgi:hypothetical protein